ncbi:hypothetical protein BN8_p06836 (plasmid) [Fibrisoma limi BUZ 3]|uniref:Uncharacterized protein n=1 Tax=Fibrisoma limi BUZ 3 TaxID=1185876 RepID=I2GU36_9BACT|nr:hypothetical protein [Fibrisoma limi]CCH57637.1 hypothetical protein BN8_p06836 [Fibrisoma limi BUZ 3]
MLFLLKILCMAKAKQSDLAPLAAIRIVLNQCKTELVPVVHQVSDLPSAKDFPDLEYYFVPAEHMELYRPYHRPGKPYKNFKLVNFERPAIKLTFYYKHKYHIDRGVRVESALTLLKEQRDELFAKSFMNQLSAAQQQKLQDIDILIRAIRETPEKFEFCTSNYEHYYKYWYCSYRYFEDAEQTKTGTVNEHLLKHVEAPEDKRANQSSIERLNVIFIDSKFITRPVPYDNKLIDRVLETYPNRISYGKSSLYIRSL